MRLKSLAISLTMLGGLAVFNQKASAHYTPILGRWMEEDPIGTPTVVSEYGGVRTRARAADAARQDISQLMGITGGENPSLWKYAHGLSLYLAYDSNPGKLRDPSGLGVVSYPIIYGGGPGDPDEPPWMIYHPPEHIGLEPVGVGVPCDPNNPNTVCKCVRGAFGISWDPLLHAYLWWPGGSCGQQGSSGYGNPHNGGGIGPIGGPNGNGDYCAEVRQPNGDPLTPSQVATIRACICSPNTNKGLHDCHAAANNCITGNGGAEPPGTGRLGD